MIKVNKDKCIGCNFCVFNCPEGFKLDSDGKAYIINQEAKGIDEMIDNCPLGAIK